MVNIFVTRRQHKIDQFTERRTVTDDLGRIFPVDDWMDAYEVHVTDSLDSFHEMMKNGDMFGFDTENRDLNQFYAIPLLLQIAIPGITYIIDQTSIKEKYLNAYAKKLFVGHNIQYDSRIVNWHMGVELERVKDTLNNAQIINRGSGRLNNLEDEYERRTNKKLPVNKKIRNDFTRMTEKSIFYRDHVIYAGFDPQACLELLPIQEEILERYNMTYRANGIANPLVPILVEMNTEGATLNTAQWEENLLGNKQQKFLIQRSLDAIVTEFAKNEPKLRGGIWSSASRKRKYTEGVQTGMFGSEITIANESAKNISYSSTPQLTKLFNILKEPLPEKEDTKEKNWEEPTMKVSFDEPTLEQYKIEYPESRMIPFINLLLEYKEVEKEINSFGEIFLREYVKHGKSGKKLKRGYFQPKTQKIHTIYKQEFTKNGRLASGGDTGKDKNYVGFYNSQQWPKKNKFRNCVTLTQEEIDNGWYISTSDLGSAELVILASKSKDPNLIKHCKGDLHSYLATHSYTRTIQYILDTMHEHRAYTELYQILRVNRLQRTYKIGTGDMDVLGKEIMREPTLSEIDTITKQRVEDAFNKRELVVDKKKYPDIRDPYKNCTYGVTYGAQDDKIAKTLNIAPYYAKLVMEGINIAIPQAMAYLNNVARFGVKYGFIEFNERTHSRHWFKDWLWAYEWGRPLTTSQKSSIERFCKNAVMSGTQADMIKEGMVNIHRYIRENALAFKWLLQVHDELVFKHKDAGLRLVVEKILTDTCNLYLDGITMDVSGFTGHCWHKE